MPKTGQSLAPSTKPATARKRSAAAKPPLPPAAPAAAKSLEPRRLPSQRRGQETVEAVLRAASQEIAEGGLDRLTTKRIAATAGLSVGAVYGYFPNKESIVSALVERWHERVFVAIDGIHPRFDTQLDLLTYLNQQIDLAARVYEEQAGLVAMWDMLPAMPAVAGTLERYDQAVHDSLSSALRHYLPRADARDIEVAAQAIPAICHELMLLALSASKDEHQRMVKVLRACVMAIASRLLLA